MKIQITGFQSDNVKEWMKKEHRLNPGSIRLVRRIKYTNKKKKDVIAGYIILVMNYGKNRYNGTYTEMMIFPDECQETTINKGFETLKNEQYNQLPTNQLRDLQEEDHR